jgi:hypothetical protein
MHAPCAAWRLDHVSIVCSHVQMRTLWDEEVSAELDELKGLREQVGALRAPSWPCKGAVACATWQRGVARSAVN